MVAAKIAPADITVRLRKETFAVTVGNTIFRAAAYFLIAESCRSPYRRTITGKGDGRRLDESMRYRNIQELLLV